MKNIINSIIKTLKKHGWLHTKDISDGYHTIGELYEHRMVLTAALFNTWAHDSNHNIRCYKSWKHHDNTMFDGMFIVVAESTIFGQISYHYNAEHWELFELTDVDNAPEWDGHTADESVERLIEYSANF
jgi:hypothetical protein